jgi:hypothetical protein
MLQTATGVEYDGSNLEDLRLIVDVELDKTVLEVVIGLIQQRYTSAYAALWALEQGIDDADGVASDEA